MVICIDKATAVRMYDKVRKFWERKSPAFERSWTLPQMFSDKVSKRR